MYGNVKPIKRRLLTMTSECYVFIDGFEIYYFKLWRFADISDIDAARLTSVIYTIE